MMKRYVLFFVFLFLLTAVSRAEDTYEPRIYDIYCWQSGDQIIILFKYHQLIGGMDNCEIVIEAFVEREGETIRFAIEPVAVKTGGYKMKGLDSSGVRVTVKQQITGFG